MIHCSGPPRRDDSFESKPRLGHCCQGSPAHGGADPYVQKDEGPHEGGAGYRYDGDDDGGNDDEDYDEGDDADDDDDDDGDDDD
eukprot:6838341-Pyramimonas_sp.AAC.1